MPRGRVLVFAAVVLLIALGIAVATVFVAGQRESGPGVGRVVSTGQPQVGGPFSLTDQNGRRVDQTMLQGKWTLVFFGFTYCPDFCPGTLQMLDATKAALGDEARDLQIVFVTIDPERDTPQAMGDYLSSDGFPEGVIGLTGTPEEIATVAREYRAVYEKVGEGPTYTMNHTLTIYLMGPDGQFRSALTSDLGPERSAEVIRRVMRRGRGAGLKSRTSRQTIRPADNPFAV